MLDGDNNTTDNDSLDKKSNTIIGPIRLLIVKSFLNLLFSLMYLKPTLKYIIVNPI